MFLHVSNQAVNSSICYLTNNHKIRNLTFMAVYGALKQYDKCKYDMWKQICLCIFNKEVRKKHYILNKLFMVCESLKLWC